MTTLTFRNIEQTPDSPVTSWGVEGLATAMERGDLTHWRRIERALEVQPRGAFADEVAEAAEVTGSEAIGGLFARRLDTLRNDEDRKDRAEVARRLAQYLEVSELTRRSFARLLGTSTSRLSTYLSGSVTPSAAILVRAERISRTRRPDV